MSVCPSKWARHAQRSLVSSARPLVCSTRHANPPDQEEKEGQEDRRRRRRKHINKKATKKTVKKKPAKKKIHGQEEAGQEEADQEEEGHIQELEGSTTWWRQLTYFESRRHVHPLAFLKATGHTALSHHRKASANCTAGEPIQCKHV